MIQNKLFYGGLTLVTEFLLAYAIVRARPHGWMS